MQSWSLKSVGASACPSGRNLSSSNIAVAAVSWASREGLVLSGAAVEAVETNVGEAPNFGSLPRAHIAEAAPARPPPAPLLEGEEEAREGEGGQRATATKTSAPLHELERATAAPSLGEACHEAGCGGLGPRAAE
mmetsp:Transcript_4697/g.17743  ORF Transcript_4697/g.17743 Transcript_4697/m.17743 type:complete len:135 (-) Transcript_4697:1821-2225(-)